MVKEVNETQVEREEQLSDKVQFCDGKTAVMENAERREARLEKAKEAEKTAVKKEAKGLFTVKSVPNRRGTVRRNKESGSCIGTASRFSYFR